MRDLYCITIGFFIGALVDSYFSWRAKRKLIQTYILAIRALEARYALEAAQTHALYLERLKSIHEALTGVPSTRMENESSKN